MTPVTTVTTVTAVTPIAAGADLAQLAEALTSAREALGEPFQWCYACHTDDAEVITSIAEDVGVEARGVILDSTNIAATRNLLTAMGTGTYLLALDADDAWAPGGLAQMKWVLDNRPEVIAAHGRTEDLDAPFRATTPPWWSTFDRETAAPGMLARRRTEIARAQAMWLNLAPGAFLADYPIHPSAGLFRRGAVLATGGWDEDLGNYAEGTALIAKLQRTGAFHLTAGTVVHLRRTHAGALADRAMTLGPADYRTLNDILDAYETGESLHAPGPPWDIPFVDRSPRPILGPDGEEIAIPTLPAGGERPAMSLVDKFVTPLIARDEAAKTEEEYAAIQAGVAGVDTEDLDDQIPDLDAEDFPDIDTLVRRFSRTDPDEH